jgi:hypothetical protein
MPLIGAIKAIPAFNRYNSVLGEQNRPLYKNCNLLKFDILSLSRHGLGSKSWSDGHYDE